MNFKQQSFVTEYLRHRDACTAYCIAYKKQSSNYEAIMSAANRLLNHPEVAGVIDSILGGIRQEVEMELKQELRKELLTIQRKREILAKIAAGEFYAVHNYKGKDCSMCSQHVWPTINQVLKAIDLDNKMAGHYTTAQVSPGNKQYIQPTADEKLHQQVDKLIESLGGEPGNDSPLPKTSVTQQNTTNTVMQSTGTHDVPPFGEDRRVSREDNNEQKFNETVFTQQNTTIISHKDLRKLIIPVVGAQKVKGLQLPESP